MRLISFLLEPLIFAAPIGTLTWAQQTGALILEDDYDSEYRYGDRPIPARTRSKPFGAVPRHFSKVLFPSGLVIWYYPNLVALFAQAVVE